MAIFAEPLLLVFLKNASAESLSIGVTYLRTEGLCYIGIGFLFLLYAIFRGLEQAGMSIVLTVLSLGLRVVLSYAFAPHFGGLADCGYCRFRCHGAARTNAFRFQQNGQKRLMAAGWIRRFVTSL